MSKNKIYIGDSSDDDDLQYSRSMIINYSNRIQTDTNRQFMSSYILEEIASSILNSKKTLEKYTQKKNNINVSAIGIPDLDDIDHFLFGKHLINKHDDKNQEVDGGQLFKQFYNKNKSLIEGFNNKNLGWFQDLKTLKDKLAGIDTQNLNFEHAQVEYSKYFPNANINARFKKYFKAQAQIDNIKVKIKRNIPLEDELSTYGKTYLKGHKPIQIQWFFESKFLETYLEDDLLPIAIKNYAYKQKLAFNLLQEISCEAAIVIDYADNVLKLFAQGNSKKFKQQEECLSIENVLATKLYIDNINREVNGKINQVLLKELPQNYFLENNNTAEEFFANFKLTHRIIRSKTKEVGIENYRNTSIRHNIELSDFTINADIEISKKGTRTDYRKLPLKRQSSAYSGLVKDEFDIKPGTSQLLKSILQGIIKGNKVSDEDMGKLLVDSRDKEFLYKFVDLLFNCEPERNASAFLTNAMFFDLFGEGKYTIKDLSDKLPMAMEGAVSGARALLDSLGGKYGELSPYLTKRQYYDFGEGDQEKAQQLAARDTAIFVDWLCSKKILQADENIKFRDKVDECGTLEELIESLRQILDPSRRQQKSIWEEKFKAVNQKLLSLFKEDTNTAHEIFKALHDLVNDWYDIQLEYLVDQPTLLKASADPQLPPNNPNQGNFKGLPKGNKSIADNHKIHTQAKTFDITKINIIDEVISKLSNDLSLAIGYDWTLGKKINNVKEALLNKYEFFTAPDISKLAQSCFDVIPFRINYNLNYLMKYIQVDETNLTYPPYTTAYDGYFELYEPVNERQETYKSRWKLVNFNNDSLHYQSILQEEVTQLKQEIEKFLQSKNIYLSIPVKMSDTHLVNFVINRENMNVDIKADDNTILNIISQEIKTILKPYKKIEKLKGGHGSNLENTSYNIHYHKSFNKYYADNIINILKLRVKMLGLEDNVKVLSKQYQLSQNNTNIDEMLEELDSLGLKNQDKVLIPYNIENKHWVGLVITKNDNILQINYMDSENKPIPENFLLALDSKNKELECDIKIFQVTVEQQKFNNCGPETIENMILLSTGNRINPQEDVVTFHSQLIEDNLLGLSSYDLGHFDL